MLAFKSYEQSMSTSKGRFYKSTYKTNGISMIFEVSGVEVGSTNRPKIDQKLNPKTDCLLASIFYGFWRVLGGKLWWKIEPGAKKNRLKNASKK